MYILLLTSSAHGQERQIVYYIDVNIWVYSTLFLGFTLLFCFSNVDSYIASDR